MSTVVPEIGSLGDAKSSNRFSPAPRDTWTLISQGAEAKVWGLAGNRDTVKWICKERFSKSYRHPDLDEKLTRSRCKSEARILEKCAQKTDLRVPQVVRVSPPLLYMEFLDGPTLKQYLNSGPYLNKTDELCIASQIGDTVGKLHNAGLVHGDLTTSNIVVLNHKEEEELELVLIDFGLAKSTFSVEEQAVDLYVLERALESTHPDLSLDFFQSILNAYGQIMVNGRREKKSQQTVLQRLEQVRQRGRKRECFG